MAFCSAGYLVPWSSGSSVLMHICTCGFLSVVFFACLLLAYIRVCMCIYIYERERGRTLVEIQVYRLGLRDSIF